MLALRPATCIHQRAPSSPTCSSPRVPVLASLWRKAAKLSVSFRPAKATAAPSPPTPPAEKAAVGFAEERQVPSTSVYRVIINGDATAVKGVAGNVSGEVGILMRVNHSCLVRLSGLCVHRGVTYLVFEFAENGALSDWLHGNGGGGNTLRWRQHVQVAFDVGDGLNYLHHYTNPPCVHKNLKNSSVLLDADLRAKVSSFGLAHAIAAADGGAQLTRHIVGTQVYLAPEHLEHGLLTPELDMFVFGVILLELLPRKEAAFTAEDEETILWESVEEAYVEI